MSKSDTELTAPAERISGLIGKRVRVRYQVDTAPGSESEEATMENVLPMGREYFFLFRMDDGKVWMLKTPSAYEVKEL